MALINDIYIFVLDEQVNRSVESSVHPVEQGIELTDHVKPEPVVINIKGELVGENAGDNLSKLVNMMNKGALVSYIGRNRLKNAQITSFSSGHPYRIHGGCEFDMEIKQVRIAESSYRASSATASRQQSGTQQKERNTEKGAPVYHTVKRGDCRWSMAQQYKDIGCTIDFITKNNNNSDCLLTVGNWYSLKVGAKVLVGYR